MSQSGSVAPGREQRVQRTAIEPAHQEVLDDEAESTREQEGNDDREEKVPLGEPGSPALADLGEHVRRIGADGEKLAVRHVDDAHLAEDDGQPQRHQEQDRKVAQAGEGLHGPNRE
jgi:hypothetical protein